MHHPSVTKNNDQQIWKRANLPLDIPTQWLLSVACRDILQSQMLQELVPMLTALMIIREYGIAFTYSYSVPYSYWWAVCAIATQNKLLSELESAFLENKKMYPILLKHTIPNLKTTKIPQYVTKKIHRHIQDTFWNRGKSLSLSFYLWLSTSSSPTPSFPSLSFLHSIILMRVISTIDTKFLFLVTSVLCRA